MNNIEVYVLSIGSIILLFYSYQVQKKLNQANKQLRKYQEERTLIMNLASPAIANTPNIAPSIKSQGLFTIGSKVSKTAILYKIPITIMLAMTTMIFTVISPILARMKRQCQSRRTHSISSWRNKKL